MITFKWVRGLSVGVTFNPTLLCLGFVSIGFELLSAGMTKKERELFKSQGPIQAIKAVRERKDCGLTEARDIVLAYRQKIDIEAKNGP